MKPADRRRAPRTFCLLVVRYRASGDAGGEWRPASVLDLTQGGCRLRAGRPPLAETLEVRFEALLHDGAKSATIEAPSRVTWSRPLGHSAVELGLEFSSPPEGLSEILDLLGPAS